MTDKAVWISDEWENRPQVRASDQDLCVLRPAVNMAPEMDAELGAGALLLETMPADRKQTNSP